MGGVLVLLNKKSPHGFSDWAWQRATAVVMLTYIAILIFRFVFDAPASSGQAWKLWFTPWLFRVSTLLFCYALIYHAWLGVREILMDYVRHPRQQAFFKKLFGAVLIIDALWASDILWRLG